MRGSAGVEGTVPVADARGDRFGGFGSDMDVEMRMLAWVYGFGFRKRCRPTQGMIVCVSIEVHLAA